MDFVQRFLSEPMIGPEGRLFRSGLIPMGDDERGFVRESVRELRARTKAR